MNYIHTLQMGTFFYLTEVVKPFCQYFYLVGELISDLYQHCCAHCLRCIEMRLLNCSNYLAIESLTLPGKYKCPRSLVGP